MKRLTRLNTKEDIIATSRLMGNDKPITDEAINKSLELFKYVSDSPLSATQKLGKLEDIEEELEVSLLLYYTMCVKGCELYCKPYINVVQYYHKYIYHAELKCFCLMIFSALTPMYYVKDYGKTWALTKEELENKGE